MGDEGVSRRRIQVDIKDGVRAVGLQLSLFSHRISVALGLRDVDLDCLNLVHRHGPVSPSEVARLAGLHRATVTGILDRLEEQRWLAREPDPDDRRAVLVRALPDRNRELFALLSGMDHGMDEVLERYDDQQLRVVHDFLARTVEAGRDATDELGG